MRVLGQIYEIMIRELLILRRNHIYRFCMVVFPILVIFFFTSMLDDGLPTSMPVGVVDLDNTSTTRSLERKLDGFQISHVVAHYPSVAQGHAAKRDLRIHVYPQGNYREVVGFATAQDFLLLYIYHAGCRFYADEGHEDYFHPWLCRFRAGYHEGKGTHRTSDSDALAAHYHRFTPNSQPLEQL